VLLMLSWVSGTNLFSLLSNDSQTPSPGAGTSGQLSSSPAEERMVDFVDAVAKDTQDTWAQLLGSRYERTRVVLFRDSIDSACGYAQSATGPFYCPRIARCIWIWVSSTSSRGGLARQATSLKRT